MLWIPLIGEHVPQSSPKSDWGMGTLGNRSRKSFREREQFPSFPKISMFWGTVPQSSSKKWGTCYPGNKSYLMWCNLMGLNNRCWWYLLVKICCFLYVDRVKHIFAHEWISCSLKNCHFSKKIDSCTPKNCIFWGMCWKTKLWRLVVAKL